MSFDACREKMQRAALASWQIDRFQRDYERFAQGDLGLLPEAELEPVEALDRLDGLPPQDWGSELARVVVIKLNGGLGTSMGLDTPKGLLEVVQGRSFLDLTVAQIAHLRHRTGAALPLLLMNSFHTREPSLAALDRAGLHNPGVPLDFLQSMVPKLNQRLEPVCHPDQPGLEWCPPGHGEIYAALRESGLLDQLLALGYRYAFVSNIDNLGAVLDATLLHWFAESGYSFAMEVTERRELDKKGGHLARRRSDRRLLLRERAQCPADDLEHFENIHQHRYFNTNNLWLHLEALKRHPLPELPLIVNRKPVDPTRPESQPIIQLESAMGAALSAYPDSQAIEVSRRRFLPVKNLSDLMLLRSDLYELTSEGQLRCRSDQLPNIALDARYFGTYSGFCQRVKVLPGLLNCRSLELKGDIHLIGPQQFEGDVRLSNEGPEPLFLPAT